MYFVTLLEYIILLYTCNEVKSQKSTFTCNEVHLRCTFENVTKYSYFVICFSALLFLVISLVDVVYISWRLVEIQHIETTLLSGSAVSSVREGKHAHTVGHLLTHV